MRGRRSVEWLPPAQAEGTFRMEIATSGAAFQPEPGPEVARILRRVADSIESGEVGATLHDINGNRVGGYWYED